MNLLETMHGREMQAQDWTPPKVRHPRVDYWSMPPWVQEEVDLWMAGKKPLELCCAMVKRYVASHMMQRES